MDNKGAPQTNSCTDIVKLFADDLQSHRDYIHRLYRSAFSVGTVLLAIGVGLAFWVLGKQLDAKVFEYRIVESLRNRANEITNEIVRDSTSAAQAQIDSYIDEEIGNEVQRVLQPEIEKLGQSTLPEIFEKIAFPAGAVLAFDRASGCPNGWQMWEAGNGRAIIGAGKGAGLVNRSFRETGGSEVHTLSVEELPAHSHSTIQMVHDNNVDGVDSSTVRSGDHHNQSRQTGVSGGGRPHNNMQPYIALKYCKKI